jgi:hypothetical protein
VIGIQNEERTKILTPSHFETCRSRVPKTAMKAFISHTVWLTARSQNVRQDETGDMKEKRRR